MRDFFRGWRRKAGCVTLGMACVFTAGWARSISTTDWIYVPVRQGEVGIITEPGTIVFAAGFGDSNFIHRPIAWHSAPFSVSSIVNNGVVTWIFRWHGLGVARRNADSDSFTWIVVPHWIIVAPLTAISACLLLSKPRTVAMTKTGEPASAEAR